MEFPKKLMTVTELTELGFDRKYLMELTRSQENNFAWKKNPVKVSSTFVFDTDRFQKFIDKQISVQRKSQRYS